jgi:hypothetical protein
VPELALTNVRKALVSTRPSKLKIGSLKRTSRHAIVPSNGNFWISELVKMVSISGPALLKALCKSETRAASPCRGMKSDTTGYTQKMPNATTKNNTTRTVIFIAIRLTKKVEPPSTRGVNRDRGTASANGGRVWRLFWPLVSHFSNHIFAVDSAASERNRSLQSGQTNPTLPTGNKMTPVTVAIGTRQ